MGAGQKRNLKHIENNTILKIIAECYKGRDYGG